MQYIETPQGKKNVMNPEAAVMSGQIKASNLEELQKFDRVFPFDPRRVIEFSEEVKAEMAAQKEPSPQFLADILFLKFLPRFYAPERLPGWSANLHFRITDAGDYTVKLDGKVCRTEKGLVGEPSCELTMTMEIMTGIVRHEILEDAKLLERVGIKEEPVELSDEMLDMVVGGRGCSSESSTCAGAACGADVCAGAACGGDVCGGAACGNDACGGAACPAATCGGAACGADICGAAGCAADTCGGAACGGDVCGGAACGAEACGGAACGADACGGAACGGDACGGALCGAEACGGAACGAEAGGVGTCPLDACGAAVCGVDTCPADACGADACGVDVCPVIPGI